MREKDTRLIADILEAADQLTQIVEAGHKRFNEEWLLRRAAERLLEIIGEAANNLSDDFLQTNPQLQISAAKRMRDLLAHHYGKVDYSQVWNTISVSVPEFVVDLTAHYPN